MVVAVLLFPAGVVLGITLGVGAVVIGARLVGSLRHAPEVDFHTYTDRIVSQPVIMRNESQEAEIANQLDGYIPPVFDNLDGLGNVN